MSQIKLKQEVETQKLESREETIQNRVITVKATNNLIMEVLPGLSTLNTIISLSPKRILFPINILLICIMPNHVTLLSRPSANISKGASSPAAGKIPCRSAVYKRLTDFPAIDCCRAKTQVTPSISQ